MDGTLMNMGTDCRSVPKLYPLCLRLVHRLIALRTGPRTGCATRSSTRAVRIDEETME